MRNILLAGACVASLALASAAFAQVVETPVPQPPPISAPEAQPDVTPEEQVGAGVIEQEAQIGAAPAAPQAQVQAPEAPPAAAQSEGMLAQPASAAQVCQPRVTSVHFGARGSALSRENRNAIEYAVDAASVCDLQQVTIVNSADGAVATRRAAAVRATLIAQGVPEAAISVAEGPETDGAGTGQLDVRMTFAGVASGDGVQASLQTAPTSD